MRPFSEKKDNIVEIINEFYFLIFGSVLLHLNDEENWTDLAQSIYMYAITSNTLVITIIITGTTSFLSLGALFIKIKHILKKCKKTKAVKIQQDPTPDSVRSLSHF
jgi:hypothetical protein